MLDVFSDGGRLHVAVGSTRLSAPMAISRIETIRILAADSISPPGGRRLVVEQDGDVVLDADLPRRFPVARSAIAPPVGDWWVDEAAPPAVVWRSDVDVRGPFTVRAVLTGRFLRFVTLDLVAPPGRSGARIRLRRGLINHDLFVLTADGTELAATSIDPMLGSSLRGIGATLLSSLAVAAGLVACSLGLAAGARRLRWRPGPSWRRLGAPAAVVAVVVATTASGWLAAGVLERLPHLPDGVASLLQARWLLAGEVAPPAPAAVEHLDVPFIYVRDGRWMTHYPVGWAALLAIGEAAGAAWAVPVILGGATVLLMMGLGRELAGGWVAVTAGLLAALSPEARLLAASHLSHAAAAPVLLLSLLLTAVAVRRGRAEIAAAAGLAVGLGLAIRPLTAAAVAAAVVAWAGAGLADRPGTRRGLAVAWGLGAALGAVPTLLHNAAVTGSALHLPYDLTGAAMAGSTNLVVGLRHLDVQLASVPPALTGWIWPLRWDRLAAALPLAFAWVPFLLRRHRRGDLLLAGVVVAVPLAHLAARAHGLHGYGPRYLFTAMLAALLLTARGMEELVHLDGSGARRPGAVPVTVILLAVLALSPAATMPERLELYRGYNNVDGRLVQQLRAGGVDDALVLFAEHDWRPWAEAASLLPGDPEGAPVVFARAGPDPSDAVAAYPRCDVLTWTGHRLVKGAGAVPEPGADLPAPARPEGR